jgi:hypothetical protein
LNLIPYLPAVGAGLVAGLLILVEARSVRLALLAIQYLAVALLSALALPLNVAMVKWVAGLMSCGILALTFSRLAGTREAPIQEVVPAGRWFRLLAILLVGSAALGLARTDWLGVPEVQPAANLGASLLMGLGLLQIGLSQARLRVGVGLMTLISGFEIAYCVVEPSLAVLALLGSIHIGLAMVISFLLTSAPALGPDGAQ